MGLKPGYKQTDVGVIPEDWQVRAFSDLGESLIGLTYKPSDVRSDGTLVLRSSNIQEGSLRFYDNVFVKSLVPERLMARPGDILICVRNGSRDLIGKCAHLDDRTLGMTFGAFMTVFRSDAHDFVYQQMRSQIVQRQITEHLGATINQITNKSLNSFEIPLPPTKAEQQTIAEALSDADALIESLEQLLGKKRQIKQGAMQELLTGKKRLPGFKRNGWGAVAGSFGMMPDDWKPTSLQKVSAFITKGATPTTYGYVWQQEGIPFLRSECVSEAGLDLSQSMFISHQAHQSLSRSEVVAGDLLITITGNVGRCVRLEGEFAEANINQHIARIRIADENVSEQFVLHFLSQSTVRRYYTRITTGQAYPQLSLVQVRETEIPLPTHAEQVAVAEVLSDMDAEITALEAKVVKARHIKQGMMQELLIGRTRLVRPSAQVLSFPVKESAGLADGSHNTHFNEAVVIAVLSAKFGSETFPLGRFRRTKFSYLLHRHVEHEAVGFMKKAAGPYNPRTRYGGAEKIALQNRYVRILHTEKGEGFVADEKITQAEGYFDKWYGVEVLTWLEQFRYQKNDALELLTTVDMACEDLSCAGKAATLSAVKQIIHDSPEWKSKLNRAIFSDDNIATTIQSCGQLFPIEEE